MDFAGLQNNVQNAMGRTDVPDYIYELVTAELNRDLRMLDMQTTVELTASSEYTNLPADFLEVESLYLDSDRRIALQLHTADAINSRRRDPGRPWGYAIVNDAVAGVAQIKLIPTPDGEHDLVMRYFQKLPDLSGAVTTNVALDRYPNLYVYGSLQQAALWAQDGEMQQRYGGFYRDALSAAQMSERNRDAGGPLSLRPGYDLSW